MDREQISAALAANDGNVSATARELGVARTTLRRYLAKLNLGSDPEKPPPTVDEMRKIQLARLEVEARRKQLRDLEKANEQDLSWFRLVDETLALMEEDRDVSWLVPRKKKDSRSQIPLAMLSDVHWGEVVNPWEIEHLNQYDSVIAGRRVQNFFDNLTWLVKDHMRLEPPGIHLALGGDIVGGEIHLELLMTNDRSLPEVVIEATDSLTSGIRHLANEFGNVQVSAVTGNHGRTSKKPHAKERNRRNIDWLVYCLVARDLRDDDRISWLISSGADQRFEVNGTKFLLTHGDQFRGGSGISGVLAPMMIGDHRKRKRAASAKSPYDYMLMGHWHQLVLGMQRIVINGSVKGYDEYAYGSNFDFEIPQQALLIVDDERGITLRSPIFLD